MPISVDSSLDLQAYVVGAAVLLLIMVFHGVLLLQIAKRYEVKTFLYLAEKKFSAVATCFYISVFCLFLTHISEILIWGISIYALKLLPSLGQSILFSGATSSSGNGWLTLTIFSANTSPSPHAI